MILKTQFKDLPNQTQEEMLIHKAQETEQVVEVNTANLTNNEI